MTERDLDRIPAIGKEIAAARDDAVRRMAALRSERAGVVRRLRAAGWTLGDLAARYGVSRTRVQQWEAGNGDDEEGGAPKAAEPMPPEPRERPSAGRSGPPEGKE